jgi:hypothetical protein
MGASSQPDNVAQLRATVDGYQRENCRSITMTDDLASELLYQVIALEEILAAPWWRRPAVRARWRRDARASVRDIDGRTFTERRSNTIGTGWLAR